MMLVSVLVPTKDRALLLGEALASIDTQRGAEFETLVLNDGGEPPVAPLGMRVVHLPAAGQSAALNAGLALARGEYLTVAQDDDLILPGKLATLRDALDLCPDAVAVYSLPRYTDPAGGPIETPARLRTYLEAHPTVTWRTVQRSGLFIHGTATMYRTAALRAIGGWDPDLRTAEEYDLHLRLLHAGGMFRAVDAVTVTYRRHAGGKSQVRKRRRGLERREAIARIYAKVGLAATVPLEAQGD